MELPQRGLHPTALDSSSKIHQTANKNKNIKFRETILPYIGDQVNKLMSQKAGDGDKFEQT